MTTTVPTYTAMIYVGLKSSNKFHSADDARAVCQAFVNERQPHPELPGGCVTLTTTEFVYGGGSEPGVAVGLINYPRFASSPALIREATMELARRLMVAMEQSRVSVVFPDETFMLNAEGVTP